MTTLRYWLANLLYDVGNMLGRLAMRVDPWPDHSAGAKDYPSFRSPDAPR